MTANLPINELAGYRSKRNHSDDLCCFYVLPTVFRTEVAKGFDSGRLPALCEAGILKNHRVKDIRRLPPAPAYREYPVCVLRIYWFQLDESEGAEQ